jgi:hypothetical protein
MMRLVKTSLLLIAFAGSLITARAEPTAGMGADFDWFGRLGITDVEDLPFVRYAWGCWPSAPNAGGSSNSARRSASASN